MSSRKRNIRIVIAIIAAYAAVLILLLAAESKAEGSSIHSLGDAIWYSVISTGKYISALARRSFSSLAAGSSGVVMVSVMTWEVHSVNTA